MIPNLVHAYWGGAPLPDWQAALLDVWREKHEVMFWTDDNLPDLRTRDLFDNPAQFSPKTHFGQFKADLLRWEVLHDYGGVWVDCDLEWRRDISPLLELPGFSAWEFEFSLINTAFMGFPAKHPALVTIVDGLRDRILSNPSLRIPAAGSYATPNLRDRDDVVILPKRQVYPYLHGEWDKANGPFDDDVWVVHHWANARRNAGM
jgi:mannosyltransferase OCH1-like enzyme